MRNFVQTGDIVEVTAPYTVKSGEGVLDGTIFGVAVADAAAGTEVSIRRVGVVDLPKASGAVAEGAPVYWDATARKVTATAWFNVLIGPALTGAATGATTLRVQLIRGVAVAGQLHAAADLDFPVIAAGASQDLYIPVPGARPGDGVTLAPPVSAVAGCICSAWVSAADTVTVRATNVTAGPLNPVVGAYGAFVRRAP